MAGSAGLLWEVADIISASRMNQKNLFVGTGAQIAAISPTYAGMKAFCTSSGSGYVAGTNYRRNTSNSAWEEDLSSTNLPYFPLSTNIGDYTTPSSATSASPPNVDILSDSDGWTLTTGFTISGNKFVGTNIGISATKAYIAFLEAGFGGSNWTLDATFDVTALTTTGNANTVKFGLAKDSSGTGFTGLMYQQYTSHVGDMFALVNDVNGTVQHDHGGVRIYYLRMSMVTSTGALTIKGYPTATDRTNDTNVRFTATYTGTNQTDLDTFYVEDVTSAGTGQMSFTIESITVNSAALTKLSQYNPAKIIDGSTSTRWETDAGANKSIYVTMASDLNMVALAVYGHANMTETQIKIRTNTNAEGTTFTDSNLRRTILTSKIIAGQWNYILLPPVLGKHLQIYGSSGSSLVMAIAEVKVRTVTDAVFGLGHKHKGISATDTDIELAA